MTHTDDVHSLQLKSRENAPGEATAGQHAVLCIPDRTYNVRQVNTSNSLFVAQLSQGSAEDEIPRPRLDAIAQSHFTLELQAATGDVSAATRIRAILPTYTSTGHHQAHNSTSKAALFSNIPASDRECEEAWSDLACFELDGEGLIPSASVKVKAWESMFNAATAEGVDLTAPLQDAQLASLVDPSGSQWPREVSMAVLRSMRQFGGSGELELDEKKCVSSVGRALLKDRAGTTSVPKASFIATWADFLPEKWRDSAELSLLRSSYKVEAGGILFVEEESNGSTTASGAKATSETKSALGAKRKWHEKFRASKKTA